MDPQQNEPTEAEATEAKPKATGAPMSPHAGAADSKLLMWFIGLFAGVFFIALILWTASLTLGIMSIVLPNNPAAKYFSLALFDGGALVWIALYTYKAKGTPQRGASLLLFVIDFLGVILMTAGGVFMGGQSLETIPAWMGGALVNGVIFATLANVAAGYYYHASRPETREAMQAQSLEDTLTEEAMRQARVNVEREAAQLGAIMARRATARIKYRLALPMSESERAEWDGETIEGQEVQPAALPAPAGQSIPALIGAWLKSFLSRRLQAQPLEPITITPNSDSSTDGPEAPAA